MSDFGKLLGKDEVRVICFRCGVSWPEVANEFQCTCAPNEVRDRIADVMDKWKELTVDGFAAQYMQNPIPRKNGER